jgi:L-lactate dehydrogenase complex protein LldG
MTATRSAFERSLDRLDVPLTRTDRAGFADLVEDLVEAPAVGVPLDETFSDPAFSLAETTVTVDPTPAALRAARTGVTAAGLGIADYGSLVLSMDAWASELVSLFVERHVAVVRAEDVLPDMDAAIDRLDATIAETRGSTILATGPSATADMGELVRGAHGPREVHVLLVEGS